MEILKVIWNSQDLRKKIIYTFLVLIIVRALAHIPMPEVDLVTLRAFFRQNELFGLLNLFTGGSMENFSLVLMGVGPYITSSIIFQLLTVVVPRLEELQKEGEFGRQKINQYTRLLTVPLSILQGYGTLLLLKNQGVLGNLGAFDLITILITITAGTLLLLWLGELISENGIGNGVSLIIALGIVSGIPTAFSQTLAVADQTGYINIVIFALIAIAVTVAIVFVNEGERQIPVTYARRVRGTDTRGGVTTYLPLKVIVAGVIPIIFAISMMIFPPVVARFVQSFTNGWINQAAGFVVNTFNNTAFYSLAYFLLVVIFTYFYTFVIFQPEQVANNIQKQGGFIPGLRPGKETAAYLNDILNRITLFGAIFLALIAVLPFLVQSITNVQTLVLGGTGVLIIVSVSLETMRQIKAQLTTRRYEF